MSRERTQAIAGDNDLYGTTTKDTPNDAGEVSSKKRNDGHSSGTKHNRTGLYDKEGRGHGKTRESSLGLDIEPSLPPLSESGAVKKWNRQISKQVPPERKAQLIKEHGDLVKKKFGQGLSRGEERRLTLIEWELDRIEDAEFGDQLDLLESIVSSQEEFADHIKNIVDSYTPPQPKRKKRKEEKWS